MRALLGELERRGLTVELNRISRGTSVCLFNSFNFDFRRLRRFARSDVRFVHRVDGPIATYRGFDDGTDARIAEVNRALADSTIVQSRYSLNAHRALGIELADPRLVVNTVDPSIFHPPAEHEPVAGRRVHVIATSWSDNANKGSDVVGWLDANLDHERYELAFAGPDDRSGTCARSGASRPKRSPRSCAGTTCTWRRAATIPARTRSWRHSRAGCRRLPRERRASGARRRGGLAFDDA